MEYVAATHFANQLSQLSPFESRGVNIVLLIVVEPAHVDGTGVPLPPVGYKYQFIAPSLSNSALYTGFVPLVPSTSISLMYSNTKILGLMALIDLIAGSMPPVPELQPGQVLMIAMSPCAT